MMIIIMILFIVVRHKLAEEVVTVPILGSICIYLKHACFSVMLQNCFT